MIRYFVAVILISYLFSCNIRNDKVASDVKSSDSSTIFKDSTSIKIMDSVYNFGKVTDGEKVEFSYRFTNSGNTPLIVTNATASCGCTVPEKPEAPIKPGETGFIKVVFNSQGRVGEVHKEITVTSNAYPAFPVLQLLGQVIEKKK